MMLKTQGNSSKNRINPKCEIRKQISYELPIITTDVWANSEYIRDGENGLVVHKAFTSIYTEGDIVHFDSPAFQKALQTVDRDMVDKLAAAIKLLIENVELRRKMGVTGREWVEKEHSMEVWRTGLKKVLDKVLSNQNDSL